MLDIVYLQAYHETQITLEGIIKKKMLGVPIEYEDLEVSFMNAKQKYTNSKAIVDEKEEVGAMLFLSYEFYEHEFIKELYSTEDIISALGGITASIKLCTGFLASAMLFKYLASLGKVIQRKYKYKYQKAEIYRMMRYFDEILLREDLDKFSQTDIKRMIKELA